MKKKKIEIEEEEIVRSREPEKALWFRTDNQNALLRGAKIKLDFAPYRKDGVLMIPATAVADFFGATIQKNRGGTISFCRPIESRPIAYEEKDGAIALALPDLKGLFGAAVYDSPLMEMSAIGLMGAADFAETLEDQREVFSIARRFIFDIPEGEDLVRDVEEHVGLGTHPRLAMTADRFELLRKIAAGEKTGTGYDDIRSWIASYMEEAEKRFDQFFDKDGDGAAWKSEEIRLSCRQPYFCFDENGEAILPDTKEDGMFDRGVAPKRIADDPLREWTYDPVEKVATYTLYADEAHTEVKYTHSAPFGDGYDVGARNNAAPKLSGNVLYYAFAWQMTGENRWKVAFRELSAMLCDWPDWGEGHYLNTADTSQQLSLGLDWIWHAFDDEPAVRERIADALYDRVIRTAYYVHSNYCHDAGFDGIKIAGKYVRMPSYNPGAAFFFYRINNWNFVCTSGTLLAILVTLEFEKYRTPEMIADFDTADSLTCAKWNLSTLTAALQEYVPDGAYSEGPGYWGYATLSHYWLTSALYTSAGKCYGLMESIGMDRTCYYICHASDSAGKVWPYHDCPRGVGATYCLFFASKYYNNPDYSVFRYQGIKAGNPYNLMDIVFFDPEMLADYVEPSHVYHMQASDIVTMRSGWENGATFTGLHGGPNLGDHTDADAGIFVLDMNGVRWVDDGSNEGYNVGDYFGPTRHFYFRKSPEGHPTVFVISDAPELVEHGQVMTTSADRYPKIGKLEETQHGSIATVDLTTAFGSICERAERAVMITKGGAVVVEDELSFNDENAEFVWNLPIHAGGIETALADDKKSATLTYGEKSLRVTLLSEDPSLSFEYLPAGADPILPGTVSKNSPANFKDGVCRFPTTSDTVQRLIVRGKAVPMTRLAVVFESEAAADAPVGYTLTAIESMDPEA